VNPLSKLIGVGFLTAISASLCCITPVLALLAGTSGIVSTFAWLEPLRPVFIMLTVGVLGTGWYAVLRSKKSANCDCESNKKQGFMQSKSWMSIVTVFSVAMLTFPYLSPVLYPTPEHPKRQTHGERTTVEFAVTGMTCNSCEQHVRHEVSKLSGVLQSEVSSYEGTATVEFDTARTSLAAIQDAINSTGYTVTGIKEQ
jgi:copper chaperone CopZ